MELNQLRCFVAVSETGSFIGAADRLNLSGPGVSKHIARLEKTLGVRLFHRSTRHVQLTEHGKRLLERVAPSLANIDEAMAEVVDHEPCPSGTLKVSVALSFGHQCLLPFFNQFIKTYPNVRLVCSFEDRYIDLNNSDVDVIIRVGQLANINAYAKRIADCPLWLCASPKLFDQHPRPKAPKDISALPTISYQHHRLKDVWQIKTSKGTEKIPFNTIMVTNTAESLLAACVDGIGVAELPAFIASEAVAQNKLVILFDEHQGQPKREIYAIYKQSLQHASRVNRFITTLCDYAKDFEWC